MSLPQPLWIYIGDKTDLVVFNRRFKIQRGRNSPLVTRVTDEQCFGIMCYEYSDTYSPITEIVPPILNLFWARRAVEILEMRFSDATITQWEALENALREIGYAGISFHPDYLPDTVGFAVLEDTGEYTIAELENLAEGEIEKYLINHGFCWRSELRTWQDNQHRLWQREEKCWQSTTAATTAPPPGCISPMIQPHFS